MLPEAFHPAVAGWFRSAFPARDRRAAQSLGRDRRRHAHVDQRADGLGQDAGRVPRRHRSAREAGGRRARCSDETQILYVSPLKALSNDIEKNLRAPLEGIGREFAAQHARRRADPRRRAHRRHAAERARAHAPAAAAHPRHDAGVAVHPAQHRVGPEHAAHGAHRHRRRNSRARRQQARRASGVVARAAGGAVRARRRRASASRPRRSRSRC